MIDELKSILPKEPVKNVYGFNNYYGVRIPELRKIAKKIVKENKLEEMQMDFSPLSFRNKPNVLQIEAAPNSQGGSRPDENGISVSLLPEKPYGQQETSIHSVDSHLVSIMCNFLLFI